MPLRTFIALKFSKNVEKYLTECVSRLKNRVVNASFTKPTNHHLTLKFLGSTKEEAVPQLIKVLEDIEINFPIEFSIIKLDGFPSLEKPRVVFLNLKCDQVKILSEKIETSCTKIGFQREKRLFIPHLTLFRLKEKSFLAGIEDFIPKQPKYCAFIDLVLFKSDLMSQGPVYTSLWQKGKND